MRRLLVTSVVAAVVLSACGGDHGDHSGGSAAATIPAGAGFGTADVVFSQSMIPHHEQAVEMAEIALDPAVGAGPEVIALATEIKGAQDPEIELMTRWLTSWGQPLTMDMSDGHDMSAMVGMMSADEMKALGAATGAEFDTLWLEMMIAHHEGAISMATDVKAESSNADVLALADAITAAQQAEIAEMKALLAG
jgi:uncharacterized protein (DUF305 family)